MAALSPANQAWVNQAAKGTGLPPAIVAAQINVESGFNDKATSPVGAEGRAQFMPATWKGLGIPGSPYQPGPASQGYIKDMSDLLHQFGGNVRNALAAYNAGAHNLPAGYGYADTILKNAGTPASPTVNAGGAIGYQMPNATGTTTVQGFNQAGFDQAQRAYLAGSFLHSPGANPFGGSSALSSLFAAGKLSTTPPNRQDFVTEQAVATRQLQDLAGGPLVNAHAGAAGDVNPIAGAVIGRTDMGVDANLKPGAPIVAPNQGRVVAITPNWYKGQPYIAVQLTAGPNKGKVMYVAEQIAPNVKVGQTLNRGAVIGRYAPSGTGIEIGWANPQDPTQTLAQATTGYTEGQQTQAGTNFRSYLGGF